MALGYENTGTGPNIIANAGNAMAADIRRVGEQIRKDIIDHKTDKQVAGLLSEAQNISPDSPTFQQDLVGVLARYPLAASDPRAQVGLKMLGEGWQQEQRKKELQKTFENRLDVANARRGGAGNRPYGGGAGGLGETPSVVSPEERAIGRSALGSPEGGFSFGAGLQKSPLGGVPFTPPPDDLPVSGGVVSEENPLFNTDLDKTLKRIRVDERTGTRIMAQDAAAKAREIRRPQVKENVTLYQDDQGNDYEWGSKTGWRDQGPPDGISVFRPGSPKDRFKKVGQNLFDVQTNKQIVPELTPAQRGIDEDRDRKANFDAIKLRVTDLEQQRKLLMDARKQAEAAGNADLALTRWNEAEVLTRTIKDLTKGLSKEQKAELESEEEKSPAYKTKEDVAGAYKAGELTREQAAEILRRDFGVK